MASYDASINLLVSGQQKVEKLLSSVNKLQGVIDSFKSTPIDLNINNFNKNLEAGQKKILDVDKKINRLYDNRIAAINQIAKLNDRIAQKEKILSVSDPSTKKYQDAARVRENAIKRQTTLQQELNESIEQSNKLSAARAGIAENQASLRSLRQQIGFARVLANSYLELGDARKYAEGKGFAPKTELVRNETSIAQIKQQAANFELLANNTRVASREFNRFTVAAQLASQKAGRAQSEQLSVLAEAFSPKGQRGIKPRFDQTEIAGARKAVGTLIGSYGEIAKSEAALGSYIERLRSLQSIVPFDSQEWSLLETAINDVSGELRQLEERFAGLRGQSSSLAKPIASLLPQFSVQSADKQARYKQSVQKKQEDQLEKLVDLEYEISKIKLDQNETLDLRNRLQEIYDDTAAGSIEAAKKQTVELKRQIRAIKDRNKEAGSDKAAGERPFATPLGGGAELKERLKTSRSIAEAEKQIAGATELAANAAQRLIGLESSQQLRSALDDYTNGLKAIEEGADKILSKNKELERQFDRSLKQSLASKRESLRVSEQFDSAVERVSGAETRIEIAAEKGLISEIEKKKLLLNLDEARLAIDEKRFTLARTITSEVDRERKSREGKIRPEIIKTGQVSPIEGRRKVEGAIRSAQILERQLLAADKQGLNVSQELADVKDAIASASSDDYQNTRKTLGVLLEANSAASDRLRLEKLIADEQKKSVVKGGTIRGGETLGLNAPRRLRNIQASGAIIEQSLINLRAKGVDTSQELVKLQAALNKTKEDGYQITQRELDSLDEQLNLARKYVQLQKEILSGQSGGGKKDKTPGAGLEEALNSLRQARQAREQFLGGTSPAEAIDKIVREFNTGKPGKGAGANVVNALVSEARAGISSAAGAGEELGEAIEDGLNKGLEIRSPSGVALRAMRNVINTAINAAKAGKAAVNAAVEDLFAPDFGSVQGVKLPKVSVASQDVIEKLANFIGRTSAKPSVFRPLAGIAGSELLSGGSVNLAMQRKAFEAGKILPETRLLPLDERRLLRGSASAPGGGLEKAIRDAAVRAVSGTGAFTGPLSSAIRSQGVIASRVFSPSSQQRAGFGGTGIFPVTPQAAIGRAGSAFPFQTYRMGGAQQFPSDAPAQLIQSLGGRGDASKAVLESIKKYRSAVDNFWEGEDSQFEAVSRVVKSSVQLAGAKLARKLTESGRGGGLSNAVDIITGEKRTGVSAYLKNTLQRISDTVLNSAEGLGYSVSNAFEDGIDRIRTGVPAAVSRGLSGISGAIGGGGGGRGGAGGGGAGGGGDFGRRLEQAVAQGPEALLGLRELAKPATASTRELEALSSVLKEFRAVLDPTVEGFDRLERQLRETAANLDRQLERRAPDADFLTRRFGPRGGRAVSEGLIGGAFPLLFGQGIGAAVGGGAGGALGGFAGGGLGFGLSLAGTALGTAFDTFITNLKELGKSLEDPTSALSAMSTAGLEVTPELEDLVQNLQGLGRTAEAQQKVLEELEKQFGSGAVKQIQALNAEQKELEQQWQSLANTLTSSLLPAITGAIAIVNDAVNGVKGLASIELPGWVKNIGSLVGLLPTFGLPREILKETVKRGQSEASKQTGTVDLSVEVKRQDLDKAVQNADQIRSLNEQWISLQRSADDIRRSNEEAIDGLRKRAIALEKEAADFRRSIEDQIADKRLEVAQKLYDNERAIRQLSIDALDIQLQRAAGGLDPIAASIVDAAREYVKIRDEGQADIERSEIQLALDLQRIENETNRQRIQIEDRVYQMTLQREEFANDSNKARMQLERQSLDYAVQVEKYRLDMTRYRYDMEIDLEKKKKIAAEGGLTGVQLNEAGIPQIVLGSGVAASVPMMTGVGASGEKAVQEELAKRGYNPAQMAAIMGSIRQESTFNPYAQEKGGTGRGLLQWSFGRAAKVPAFTGDYKTDIKNQIDLFEQELRTSEKKAGEMLARATTLDQAAAAMKQFERYGAAGKRYDYMRDYFSRFTGGAGTMPPVAATPPAAAAAPEVPTAPPTAPVSPAMSLINFPATPGGVQYLDLIEQSTEAQALNAEAIKEANDVQKRQIELRVQAAQLALQEKVLSPLRQYQEQNRELDFELEKRKERNRLLAEGVKPEIVEGKLRVLEISRALNSVLQGLEVSTNERTKAALAMAGVDSQLVDSTFRLTEATLASLVATTEDVEKQKKLRKELEAILKLRNDLAEKAKGAAGAAAAGARDSAAKQAEPGLKIQEFIAQATAELTDFESLAIRVSQGVGDAVGNSLASGITGLIEGTTTAKEIFAGFLKDVGQILIREGTKMIATYIAIGIAKQFAGLFTQSNAAKNFEMPNAAFIPEGGFKFPGAANGAYFDGGMSYFANGGIVTSPTLFQFADGGVTQAGLMGEAGPEAIMPLKRGADGKLGVQVADNREFLSSVSSDAGEGGMEPGSTEEAATLATRASVREIERLQENRTQIMTQQMEAERRYERERIEQMASTPGNLNIKYESQVINNVEYVTRDQAERMAAQSALRGRELAIGALQNSVKTRKRVGI